MLAVMKTAEVFRGLWRYFDIPFWKYISSRDVVGPNLELGKIYLRLFLLRPHISW